MSKEPAVFFRASKLAISAVVGGGYSGVPFPATVLSATIAS